MAHFEYWPLPVDRMRKATVLRAGIAANRVLLSGHRLAGLLAKQNFNPGQPRVPAGNSAGGQWAGGGGSSGADWRKFPRKSRVGRSPSHIVPKNSLLFSTANGQTFWAPPGTNFQDVFQAGRNLSNIAQEDRLRYIKAHIGHDGIFDFQRTPSVFWAQYTDASNYGVGVFMRGAGFTRMGADARGILYALRYSSGGSNATRLAWWHYGYDDAYGGQLPSPLREIPVRAGKIPFRAIKDLHGCNACQGAHSMKNPTRRVFWMVGVTLACLVVVSLLYFLATARIFTGGVWRTHPAISSSLGDRVIYDQAIGFDLADYVNVSLVEAHGGNRGVVFSYYPESTPRRDAKGVEHIYNSSEPQMRWLDDTTILIEVERVWDIRTQLRHLGRDTIVYRIRNPATTSTDTRLK